MQMKSKFYRIK